MREYQTTQRVVTEVFAVAPRPESGRSNGIETTLLSNATTASAFWPRAMAGNPSTRVIGPFDDNASTDANRDGVEHALLLSFLHLTPAFETCIGSDKVSVKSFSRHSHIPSGNFIRPAARLAFGNRNAHIGMRSPRLLRSGSHRCPKSLNGCAPALRTDM